MAERARAGEAGATDFNAKEFVQNLTQRPGVYRMIGANGDVLYVGKARNLRKRVGSYFSGRAQEAKTIALVRQIENIDVTVTRTEAEALMLEYNLIKQHKPKYNVLLRDDKSYPYIHISVDDQFPRISFYRGTRKVRGRLFGPYPNAGSVRESLSQLQKLFRIRQCEDTTFRGRSRPCLQYQIGRCTAPCVGLVSEDEYRRDIESAMLFLQGDGDAVIERLAKSMEAAAEAQAYERAAQFRDRLIALRNVQSNQLVSRAKGEFDLVGVARAGDSVCVAVMFFRGGRSLGSRHYFPRQSDAADDAEILRAFLLQYYTEKEAPGEILVSADVVDGDGIAELLTGRKGSQVQIRSRVRGDRAKLLQMTIADASHAAEHRARSRASLHQQFTALETLLELEAPIQRIECFDISHISGQDTVGSCVAFNREGALKSAYRRYNVKGIEPGDDYAAMRQVLTRRYSRVVSEESPMPDVVLIDGGKGQLRQAVEVFDELGLIDVPLLGVAKGEGRRPGRESLHRPGTDTPLRLPQSSPALTLIQQLRDESHRFALAGHRAKRQKRIRKSTLDEIRGLGPKRKQALMRQFGGLQGIASAGADDLARVNGISPELAQRIYDRFHTS